MAVSADVVVVGAGPTGLLLAGDLAAAGVSCVVVERRAEESNMTRAFAVHARTLEELDARGVADELVGTGAKVDALRLFDRLEIGLSTLPSRFPYLLITPQYQTERVLEERAVAAGATIVRGAEVVGLRQDGSGVEVDARSRDGATTTYRAAYAVGADGVRSTVRELIGQPFPGRAVVRSLMLADVRLADPPENVLAVNAVGECFAFVAPFGDGWYRIFAWNRSNPQPDSAPLDLAEVRAVTQRALGTDFGMHDPRWMSRFHSDERQVPQYRTGRVFLAGDAAHCHSPAGGQGMNTGLQDAANLGWKLAAVVRGWSPDGLLDTYHEERHPVGRMVLRSSGAIIRAAMIQGRVERAARNLVGAAATKVGPIARKVAGMITGIGIAYPRPHGAHPLVGQRAADLPVIDGAGRPVRLYEALRAGRFVMVVPGGVDPTVVEPWTGRVDAALSVDTSAPLTLVRPDGYVAWAGRDADPRRQVEEVQAAVTRWCGAPPIATAR